MQTDVIQYCSDTGATTEASAAEEIAIEDSCIKMSDHDIGFPISLIML